MNYDNQILSFTEYNYTSFLNAVHILYFENNQELKSIADKYLCEFDKHPNSWNIANEILKLDKLELEAYFNATQIIKKKLKYDFGNFCENVEICQNLGNILFDLLNKFKTEKFYLVSNICICMAYLIFFSHKIMPGLIELISSKFRGQDLLSNHCLVLIFSYMSELLEDEFVIDEDYFKTYVSLLDNMTDFVFSFIAEFIESINQTNMNDKRIKKSIIECLKNWLSLRLNKKILEKLENQYKIILEFIFSIDSVALENYSECICALLEKSMKNKELITLSDFIYNRIIALKPKVEESIKLKDYDEMKFFIDIFQDLLHQKMEILFNENKLDTLQLMCQLSVNAPYSKIDSITSFWQSFMYYINEKQFPKGEVLNVFNKLLVYLFRNLIKRLKFDTSVFIELNVKRTKQIKDSSNNLSDLYHETKEIRDSLKYFFQDYSNFFTFKHFYSNYLVPEIKQNIDILKEKPDNIQAWSLLEGDIYCFYCICNTIDKSSPEEMNYLGEMMEIILQIPKDNIQVTRTFSDIVEHVSKIFKHSDEKVLLIKTLKFFVERIDQDIIIKYVSSSIKNLLSDNKMHFYDMRKELIELFISKINLKLMLYDDYFKILDGILEILALNNGTEEIKIFLLEILKPWANKMLMLSENKIEVKEELVQLEKVIDVIKGIIKSSLNDADIDISSFLSGVFKDLWVYIQKDIQYYEDNEDIIESICQLVKYFMRAIKSYFYENYMKTYLEKMVSGYQVKPISSYLYSFEVIVDAYYNDPNCHIMLMQTFEILCKLTFSYLPTFKSFEDNTDLSEDFFGLLNRIIKVHPLLIFESQLLEGLFNLSTNCINISHIDTGNYVIDFLTKIFEIDKKYLEQIYKVSNDFEKIIKIKNGLISVHGDKLVVKIINYIISVPSNEIYLSLRDLIMIFSKKYEKDFSNWFRNSLIDIPNDCLTNSEKEKYFIEMQKFDEEKTKRIFDKIKRRCLNRMFRS